MIQEDGLNMPATSLYNLSSLTNLSRGDTAFIQQMLGIFISASEHAIVQFKYCFEQSDLIGIGMLAHKIKPSIDTLEVITLREKIRQLESYGLGENSDLDLRDLVFSVCNNLQLVVDELIANEME